MDTEGCRQPFNIHLNKPNKHFNKIYTCRILASEKHESIYLPLLKQPGMIFYHKVMRHFQTRIGAPTGLGIVFGTALIAFWGLRLWRSVLTRTREVKAARAKNKEACDCFIRRRGLPDILSIVWAIGGKGRRELRSKYWNHRALPNGIRRDTFAVVSMNPGAPTVTDFAHRSIARRH